jgi:putative ABC transport system permease protein
VQKVADWPSPDVQTRQSTSTRPGQINTFLIIIYVLLVLVIIIALFGIANTLSPGVNASARLLRGGPVVVSCGRWCGGSGGSSVVFGTIGGIILGTPGWGSSALSLDAQDFPTPFTVPVGQLLGILIVGAIVGVLAGWRPARRAAKLDILQAIASE